MGSSTSLLRPRKGELQAGKKLGQNCPFLYNDLRRVGMAEEESNVSIMCVNCSTVLTVK